MDYEGVIGIEVHAQLKTASKMFCSCSTNFDALPNHNCCPVCLGFPGVLPVMNRRAIEFVIKTAMALNCEVPEISRFARKNYYYPDLPKAYQISQYELPIGMNGWIEIEVGGERKKIRINRVHLEEDAGKLNHDVTDRASCVDYNRVGIPLMEVVTEADIRNSEESVAYLTQLHSILKYIGVCEGSMEKGQMRCEPNISVRPVGQEQFGVKTEIKNLNSFRAVKGGVDYEIKRQIKSIGEGGKIVQETRRWDDVAGVTLTMRSKESAHDYRYFPDPDLAPVKIDAEWMSRLRADITELPLARRDRFIEQYGLSEYDAGVLTASRDFADYFEKKIKNRNPKLLVNFLINKIQSFLNEKRLTISDIDTLDIDGLLDSESRGATSGTVTLPILRYMYENNCSAEESIQRNNFSQVSDEGELGAIVDKVIAANPGPVDDLRNGKEKAIGFLVGQVMKDSKGKANPQVVNRLIREKIFG